MFYTQDTSFRQTCDVCCILVRYSVTNSRSSRSPIHSPSHPLLHQADMLARDCQWPSCVSGCMVSLPQKLWLWEWAQRWGFKVCRPLQFMCPVSFPEFSPLQKCVCSSCLQMSGGVWRCCLVSTITEHTCECPPALHALLDLRDTVHNKIITGELQLSTADLTEAEGPQNNTPGPC